MDRIELKQDLEDKLAEPYSRNKVQLSYEWQVDRNKSDETSSIDTHHFFYDGNDDYENENELDETSIDDYQLFNFENIDDTDDEEMNLDAYVDELENGSDDDDGINSNILIDSCSFENKIGLDAK